MSELLKVDIVIDTNESLFHLTEKPLHPEIIGEGSYSAEKYKPMQGEHFDESQH